MPGTGPGGPEGAPLENYANKSSASPRNRRYGLRSGLWRVSALKRCRVCGRHVRNESGEVGVRLSEGHAGFAGLVTCGSVWVCPVCSSKIMARRALEIGSAVAAAQAGGLHVVFLTLTMRHRQGQRLGMLWDALAHGWERVTSGRRWVADRERWGVIGYCRAVETTIGTNGWHVHVHALLFLDVERPNVDALCDSMWERWSAGLTARGLAVPLRHASEAHLVTGDLSGTALGDYLTKGVAAAGALGMELTQTQSKVAQGVHKTRPVWSLLDEGALEGEAAPLRLWHEWERASKGRRQIAWSRGLRDLLGLSVAERTDEEIAGEQLGSEDDTIVTITRHGWASLVQRPELIPDVLNTAEAMGPQGLSAWLDGHGIEHRLEV
jgi:hypothetical protein